MDGMFFNLHRFLPLKHRRMKKFVLHCNRCTVVTRFFNLFFSVYKRKVPLERGCQAKLFLGLNSLIFLLHIDLEEISQQPKMVGKDEKLLFN